MKHGYKKCQERDQQKEKNDDVLSDALERHRESVFENGELRMENL